MLIHTPIHAYICTFAYLYIYVHPSMRAHALHTHTHTHTGAPVACASAGPNTPALCAAAQARGVFPGCGRHPSAMRCPRKREEIKHPKVFLGGAPALCAARASAVGMRMHNPRDTPRHLAPPCATRASAGGLRKRNQGLAWRKPRTHTHTPTHRHPYYYYYSYYHYYYVSCTVLPAHPGHQRGGAVVQS